MNGKMKAQSDREPHQRGEDCQMVSVGKANNAVCLFFFFFLRNSQSTQNQIIEFEFHIFKDS